MAATAFASCSYAFASAASFRPGTGRRPGTGMSRRAETPAAFPRRPRPPLFAFRQGDHGGRERQLRAQRGPGCRGRSGSRENRAPPLGHRRRSRALVVSMRPAGHLSAGVSPLCSCRPQLRLEQPGISHLSFRQVPSQLLFAKGQIIASGCHFFSPVQSLNPFSPRKGGRLASESAPRAYTMDVHSRTGRNGDSI